jgi:hypothetical protein
MHQFSIFNKITCPPNRDRQSFSLVNTLLTIGCDYLTGSLLFSVEKRLADRLPSLQNKRNQSGSRTRKGKEQHVASLLLPVLPVKSLIINTCCRVADFPD